MKEVIVDLNFEPKVVRSRLDLKTATKGSLQPIPEPVASALGKASKTNRPLFITFHAEWCGACQIMDSTTFKDPAVKNVLENFAVIRVDADQDEAAVKHFNVVGMPTLLVLDVSGKEIYRQVGPIEAAELTQALSLRHLKISSSIDTL